MTSFTITVQDEEVQATLKALSARVGNMRPVLHTIGEGIVERTKRRFETSKGPDGVKWEANSDVTLGLFTDRLAGQKSKVKKDGSLNAAGERALANKKPLIGESGDLRRQFDIRAVGDSLTVASTPKYAAIQQFGGTLGPKTWFPGKKIPPRPFLPIHQNGNLYPAEQSEILKALNEYLIGGL